MKLQGRGIVFLRIHVGEQVRNRYRSMKAFLKTLAFGITATVASNSAIAGENNRATGSETTSPIRNIVVIFQENVSFDHYFATYPKALDLAGEPRFDAKPDTPTANGLDQTLLTNNPNLLQQTSVFALHRRQLESG